MVKDIKADAYRVSGATSFAAIIKLAVMKRTFRPILTLRLCQWSATRCWPFWLVAKLLHRWAQVNAGMDLPATISAGPGLLLVHGWGIVVNQECEIGSNVTLFNGVVLGQKDTITADGRTSVYPIVENEAWIGPHAIVIGVKIGEGAIVGGGSVVTKDVPPHCVVVGNPARIVKQNVLADVVNRVAL